MCDDKFQGAPAASPSGRPRLLFLGQTTPFPPDQGAKVRAFHLLRSLAKAFDVTLCCFYRSEASSTSLRQAQDALTRLASSVRLFPIIQEQSRIRMAWDHFRSVAQQKVYTVFTYESRALLHHLDSIGGSGAFDLIHVDSLDLARYLPYLKGVPIVLGHHNVESALLARRASVETSRLLRLYLRHQSRLMAREEARWAPKVNLNLVCSKEDAQSLRGIPGKARVAVMPNGVDTTYLRPLTTEGSGILFLGAYDWFPNRDGMSFFLRQILPEIRSQVPDSTVTWVGRVPDGVRKDLGERFRLKFTGHVPDFRPWVKAAACMIVPLRVGGGTRLKIIEGWSMGQAMVSTTLGCEGLRARDGENLLIRDEPKAFAEAVIQLLSEPGLRKHLGENGRVTAVEQYDWGALAGPMLRQYQRVLASDP